MFTIVRISHLIGGGRDRGDPGASVPAVQCADQRQQIADRLLLGLRQPGGAAMRQRLAVVAAAASAIAARPVLIAELLEHELAPTHRVVRVLDHRLELLALDLGAPRQTLDVEHREHTGLGPGRRQPIVIAPQHAVALEDPQRRAHRYAHALADDALVTHMQRRARRQGTCMAALELRA